MSCRPSLLLCHRLALGVPIPREETFHFAGFHLARDDALQHIGSRFPYINVDRG